MTDRELMQQALEALELITRNLNKGMSGSIQKLVARENQDVIAALRERLARQEPTSKYSDIVSDGGLDPRNAFDKPARQEQEQEPVAYRHLHEDGWEYYDAPVGDDCPGCIPLYTATQPAQQPLTDEQVEALYNAAPAKRDGWKAFARAIEAAHGITGADK